MTREQERAPPRTRGCIPGSPGESGLVSRGSQGLRSPLESRRGPRVSLECNPEIPVAPGVEHYVLDTSLDEVYFALQ